MFAINEFVFNQNGKRVKTVMPLLPPKTFQHFFA